MEEFVYLSINVIVLDYFGEVLVVSILFVLMLLVLMEEFVDLHQINAIVSIQETYGMEQLVKHLFVIQVAKIQEIVLHQTFVIVPQDSMELIVVSEFSQLTQIQTQLLLVLLLIKNGFLSDWEMQEDLDLDGTL